LAVRLQATSTSHGAGAPRGSIPRARLPGSVAIGATVTPCGAHRVGFTLPSSGSSAHRPAPRKCHGSLRTRAGGRVPQRHRPAPPLQAEIRGVHVPSNQRVFRDARQARPPTRFSRYP